MNLKGATAIIQDHLSRRRGVNLIYLQFPVKYVATDPTRQVAQALGVEPVSVMGLLMERFGDRWQQLVAAEQQSRLDVVSKALEQALVDRVETEQCVVFCDTEVLYAFPNLNPTALLYPHSSERVIVVGVKAATVAEGLRLLVDGPVYPTGNCTVLEIE